MTRKERSEADALAHLRAAEGWLHLDKAAGMGLLRCGLAEGRPMRDSRKGWWEFRLLPPPGPYQVRKRKPLLVEVLGEVEGQGEPLWVIIDTRQPPAEQLDSQWFDLIDARNEADRLNERAKAP